MNPGKMTKLAKKEMERLKRLEREEKMKYIEDPSEDSAGIPEKTQKTDMSAPYDDDGISDNT